MRAAGFYCGIGRKGVERLEVRGVIRRGLGPAQLPAVSPRFFQEEQPGMAEGRGC